MSAKKLLSLFLLLLIANGALAQTRYIKDEIYVPIRAGVGNQYRILRVLPSGTQLKLIEEVEEGKWAHIETPGGERGWVETQYLQEGPISEVLLKQAQARIAELTSQRQNLGSQATDLQTENKTLTEELEQVRSENTRLSSELEEIRRISAGTLELNQRHQQLLEEHQMLQTQLDVSKAENERLAKESRQTWFLYGAIAVGLGVILTLISQTVKSRRRYSEWA